LSLRVICSSVNPSARRSATHASCMASSSVSRAVSDDTTTNRQGSLWCGAGAVSAAAIARSTAAGSTGCAWIVNRELEAKARDLAGLKGY
jgi:hypothetical protein